MLGRGCTGFESRDDLVASGADDDRLVAVVAGDGLCRGGAGRAEDKAAAMAVVFAGEVPEGGAAVLELTVLRVICLLPSLLRYDACDDGAGGGGSGDWRGPHRLWLRWLPERRRGEKVFWQFDRRLAEGVVGKTLGGSEDKGRCSWRTASAGGSAKKKNRNWCSEREW